MLNTSIKERTKVAHQELEKEVINRIKAISSSTDYAELLTYFHQYFSVIEEAIAPYLSDDILEGYSSRRTSKHITTDILALNAAPSSRTPKAQAPVIDNTLQAIGALYVLEGSIMGGPYIIQMLRKKGIEQGFTFFSGYGPDTAERWHRFIDTMNALPKTPSEEELVIESALATFRNFNDMFQRGQ